MTPSSDAEYKLVTILFADVVRSTDLTDRLGAERARVVLDRCLQRMAASVEEYGGTVAQFMGDGILAFFGAPLAHEDDPERVGLAALKMHEAVRQYSSELGEVEHLRGNDDLARGHYSNALAAFEGLGAAPDVDRARAALESLG